MVSKQVLQCSINRAGCQGKATRMCHHCGRLLCEGYNCCKWGWDAAFAGWPIAYHCPRCEHLPRLLRWMRDAVVLSNRVDAHLSKNIERIGKTKVVTKIWKAIHRVAKIFAPRRKPREATD